MVFTGFPVLLLMKIATKAIRWVQWSCTGFLVLFVAVEAVRWVLYFRYRFPCPAYSRLVTSAVR